MDNESGYGQLCPGSSTACKMGKFSSKGNDFQLLSYASLRLAVFCVCDAVKFELWTVDSTGTEHRYRKIK